VPIFFGLIACNLIWSAHPLMSKWMLEDFSPAQVVWLRYSCACFAFFVLSLLKAGKSKVLFLPSSKKDLFFMILMGALTYCYSPLLQVIGLKESRVSENSLIIAIEPILTVFLAFALFQERLKKSEILGLLLSVVGFALLSGLKDELQSQRVSAHFIGNILIFCSLLGEASFSVLGSQLARRYSPQAIFGTTLFLGLVFLTVSLALIEKEVYRFEYWISFLNRFSSRSFLALLWLGPLGTTGGYLYALRALSQVSVVSVTLLLFVQPLVGVLLGHLFYRESLSEVQVLGSFLMMLSLTLSIGVGFKNSAVQRE